MDCLRRRLSLPCLKGGGPLRGGGIVSLSLTRRGPFARLRVTEENNCAEIPKRDISLL